jgi:hypothetical protein
MPSVWIRTLETKDGKRRYIVGYRVGGRETKAVTVAASARSSSRRSVRNGSAGELAARRTRTSQT